MTIDYQSMAGDLYGGGWRAEDKEWLKTEYELTDDEVDYLCDALEKYEELVKLEQLEDLE